MNEMKERCLNIAFTKLKSYTLLTNYFFDVIVYDSDAM